MNLKKELNLMDVFSIASGAMISSGIFILPGLAYAKAGPAVIVSYFLAGLLAMTGMLSVAELTTAMPKAGGDYFFITRSLGPAVGTISGLLSWFSLSLKAAFALVGMSAFTVLIVSLDIHLIAVVFLVVFLALNYFGAKEAGRTQVFLVAGLLILMLFYIIAGLPMIQLEYFQPFAFSGLGGIFSTAGFVFVSYGGLLKVASVAEEIKKPGKNIPLGMIFSLLVVVIFYSFLVFVTVGILPKDMLSSSLTPISDSAKIIMGVPGQIALSIAAILAFVSTANAGILSSSRYPFALSRDGLIPPFFEKLSSRFQTPSVAILVTGIFMLASLFLQLDVLIKAASTVLIMTYILSNVSVIILRESRVQNYQPVFKAPFYPWTQILGIIGFVFLIFEMGMEAILISLGLILLGFSVYWFYGRKDSHREYALLHLIERVMDREITQNLLESELKEIIRERDNIVEDRFDQVVSQSLVLDLENAMSLQDFFHFASEEISKTFKLPQADIQNLLTKREEESSTVILPSIAFPHVIIETQGVFHMVIARSRQGINFGPDASQVKTAFILLASKDERNFYLKSLSALAQIVQDLQFESRWMAAKNEQALKDILLLSQRKR